MLIGISFLFSDSSESNEIISSELPDSNKPTIPTELKTYIEEPKIKAYVDFSKFYENVEKARREGTLPDDFDFEL